MSPLLGREVAFCLTAVGGGQRVPCARWGNRSPGAQPVITAAANVRPFLDRYADANCTLSNGEAATMMTRIEDGELPPAEWFVGKRPMDVERYKIGPYGPKA